METVPAWVPGSVRQTAALTKCVNFFLPRWPQTATRAAMDPRSSSSFPLSKSSWQVPAGALRLVARVLGSKVPRANLRRADKVFNAPAQHLLVLTLTATSLGHLWLDKEKAGPYASASASGLRAPVIDLWSYTKVDGGASAVCPTCCPRPALHSLFHWGLAARSRTKFGQGPRPLPWMRVVPASAGGCQSAKGTVLA